MDSDFPVDTVHVSTKEEFRLLLIYYQREHTWSLGLACLSGYVKHHLTGIRVHLIQILEGDSIEEFVERITKLNPDLIGISAMDPTWRDMLPYLDALESLDQSIPLVVGGYQAIFSPHETISRREVTHICVGDGEQPLVDLIRSIKRGNGRNESIPGLWVKDQNSKIIEGLPIMTEADQMSYPDYSLWERDGRLDWLSEHAVESKSLNTLPALSGRGCPFRCKYCCNTALLQMYRNPRQYLRKHDPVGLTSELARIRDSYAIDYFHFMDESLTWDRKHAYRFMDLYGEKVGLPFSMFTRIDEMDERLCEVASRSGCHTIWIGVESGSEDYRRRYLGRRTSNRKILEGVETARRHGIKLLALLMIGMPYETREDILMSIDLIKRIRAELTIFSQFLPFPGTEIYELCKSGNLLLDPSQNPQLWNFGTLNIREHSGGVSQKELDELIPLISEYLVTNNRLDE